MTYRARLIFLFLCLSATTPILLDSSFTLPSDKTYLDSSSRPIRNSIFSSVKNNTVASSAVPIDAKSVSLLAKKPVDAPLFNFEPPVEPVEAKSVAKSFAEANSESGQKDAQQEPKKLEEPKKFIEVAKAASFDQTPEDVGVKLKKVDHVSAQEEEQMADERREANVLYQAKSVVDDEAATVAFNFEEASLSNLVSYIETIHNIKFITDDIVSTGKPAQGFAGHKITFRTNKKLTKKESWDLFLTFVHIAGLDVIPMPQDGFYRIVPVERASSEPIPAFIGVDVNVLPDTDMIVRYVYFVKNIEAAKVQNVILPMKSPKGKIDVFSGLKALIFTDRACNVKSLMSIVLELDRGGLPEVLSVIKLKRASAKDVKALYESLKTTSSSQPERAWAPGKKESSLEFFPQNVSIVSDDRTNSLIVLGTAKDVARVEEFITKHVDIAIERSAPPVFTYRLQYTNAKDVAGILQSIVTYSGPAGSASDSVAKYGGVRDGVRYFQPMTIGHDNHSNSLIINSTQEDFETLKPLIKDLDIAQKQVGLEVLMVLVSDVDTKTLGAQISGPNGLGNVAPGSSSLGPTFLQTVTAQTSGVPQGTPIVTTLGTAGTTDFSLKSSLASLLGSSVLNETGSILVTLGQPIWAIFKVLKTITSTHIISNPFVVVSNNQTALIKSGQSRQQVSGQIISSGATKATGFVPVEATLNVTITPQITKGNIFNLAITVRNDQFIDATDTASIAGGAGGSPINKKEVTTTASVANGETLVIGGIMTESYSSTSNGVPFLENIPVFGWFFKSKSRTVTRDHFLIFIAPRLLDPVEDPKDVDDYTDYKLREAQENIELIDNYDWFSAKKDPVQRAFFGTNHLRSFQELNNGKSFAKRMGIDEKINHLEVARKSEPVEQPTQADKKRRSRLVAAEKSRQRLEKRNKLKQEKKQRQQPQMQQEEPLIIEVGQSGSINTPQDIKNSIRGSVQPGKVQTV